MKRSKFSLSNYKLLTCDMGELVPIGLTEVLPGDTFQQATSLLVRCNPLVSPVMHPVDVRVHHWFVPHRIVWNDFEDFITGGPDGNSTPSFPVIQLASVAAGSLADYLGIPPANYAASHSGALEVSALPFRAYQTIFNEWYRDQDLTAEASVAKTSGLDILTSQTLQLSAWEKDYFTSARPWTQKGPDVNIPFGSTAPVVRTNNAPAARLTQAGTNTASGDGTIATALGNGTLRSSNGYNLALDPQGGLVADLSSATAVNVNVLREAFALQRYEEARARYGSRYTEYLRYLGVRSSDARLQRPEYLGGGRQTIQFSEVLQTGEGTDPVATMRGHGIGALRTNRYRRFFEEHGYVVSLLSVRPKTIYAQGLPRTWNRRTKEDFFQRELQHIGQQEIQNQEVYTLQTPTQRLAMFGYQDRYDEYRRSESSVAGGMRNTTFDNWHMARIFTAAPVLNGSFVQANPTKRVFADTAEDGLLIMANHSIQARRLVSGSSASYIY